MYISVAEKRLRCILVLISKTYFNITHLLFLLQICLTTRGHYSIFFHKTLFQNCDVNNNDSIRTLGGLYHNFEVEFLLELYIIFLKTCQDLIFKRTICNQVNINVFSWKEACKNEATLIDLIEHYSFIFCLFFPAFEGEK